MAKSQQRPTPLAGRAEVLSDYAEASYQSVLNAVSGSVLAPPGKEHCAPTCHGPISLSSMENFTKLQRMAAPVRGAPPVGAASPLWYALNPVHGSTPPPSGAEQHTQTCRGLRFDSFWENGLWRSSAPAAGSAARCSSFSCAVRTECDAQVHESPL